MNQNKFKPRELPEIDNADLCDCELCSAKVPWLSQDGRCPNCAAHAEHWAGIECSLCGACLSDDPEAVRVDHEQRWRCGECEGEEA